MKKPAIYIIIERSFDIIIPYPSLIKISNNAITIIKHNILHHA